MCCVCCSEITDDAVAIQGSDQIIHQMDAYDCNVNELLRTAPLGIACRLVRGYPKYLRVTMYLTALADWPKSKSQLDAMKLQAILFPQVAAATATPLRTAPNPLGVLTQRESELPTIFACAVVNWPPTTVGVLNVPQTPPPALQSMLAEVDPANIEASILKLVSFGTWRRA